jgi:deazaflavin-dependent oxidoreductase (nitroreductase family)
MVILLQRLGLPLGTIHILSVLGRRSGKLRSTPVSLLTMDGERYLVGGLITADWVKNARAAGWGILRYGRQKERIGLVELPEEERAPILRAFPRLVPHGVQFFKQLYGLPTDPAQLPDAFAALAPRSTVFRIDSSPHSPR